ncbi:MAG TPA: tetratricopeptide repeat protein [Candidatus Hydrogenedentes bacterium]|nr:tetratricopeptide repeat protein [Candidatus Hydrogenedentota bacterium]
MVNRSRQATRQAGARFAAVGLLVLMVLEAHAGEDPCARAESLFAQGDYSQGRRILVDTAERASLSVATRAGAMDRLARFFVDDVGDFAAARRWSERLLDLDPPVDDALRRAARGRIARLDDLDARYREENAILERVRFDTHDADEIEARVADLTALIKTCPDFPNLARAYYYLGENLLSLQRYREAYRAFRRAAELRPRLDLEFSMGHDLDVARGAWFRSAAARWSKWTLAFLIALAAVLFFRTKPYAWLGWRHALGLVVVCGAWCGVLMLAACLLGRDITAGRLLFEDPVFLSGMPGSPGSEPLRALLLYGCAGLIGCFAFAAGTSRGRFRAAALVANAGFALVAFAALLAGFYMEHCDSHALIDVPPDIRLPYAQADFFFQVPELSPYVLTEPRVYPGLDTSGIYEPEFRVWLERQYEIILNTAEDSL